MTKKLSKMVAISALILLALAPSFSVAISNSLSDCLAVASAFDSTCGSTTSPASSVSAMTGATVSCSSWTGGSTVCPGTFTAASGKTPPSCSWTRKLCATCYTSGSTVKMRIQTNGLPSSCMTVGQAVSSTMDIDYEVTFNPDVSTATYYSPATQTAVDGVLCNIARHATPPTGAGYVLKGSTALSTVFAVSIDGVMILNPNMEGNVDPLYNSYGTSEAMDTCLAHTQAAGLWHYHTMSPCMKAKKTTTAACSATSSCYGLYGSYMLSTYTSSYKYKLVLGMAKDGHPLYGPYNTTAGNLVTAMNGLDVCNGQFDSSGNYAYYATTHYPYTSGCFGPGNYPSYTPSCSTNKPSYYSKSGGTSSSTTTSTSGVTATTTTTTTGRHLLATTKKAKVQLFDVVVPRKTSQSTSATVTLTIDLCAAQFDSAVAVILPKNGSQLGYNNDYASGKCPQGSNKKASFLQVKNVKVATHYTVIVTGGVATAAGNGTLRITASSDAVPTVSEIVTPIPDTSTASYVYTGPSATGRRLQQQQMMPPAPAGSQKPPAPAGAKMPPAPAGSQKPPAPADAPKPPAPSGSGAKPTNLPPLTIANPVSTSVSINTATSGLTFTPFNGVASACAVYMVRVVNASTYDETAELVAHAKADEAPADPASAPMALLEMSFCDANFDSGLAISNPFERRILYGNDDFRGGDCPSGSKSTASFVRFPVFLDKAHGVIVSGGASGGSGKGTLKLTVDSGYKVVYQSVTVPIITGA